MDKSVLLGIGVALGFSGYMAPFLVLADHEGIRHIEAGKNVYEGICVACHGPKGKGIMPGIPDFTKKNNPLSKTDTELFNNIKFGFESPGSFMAMPAMGTPAQGEDLGLTDQEIKYVVEYLREEFQKK